MSPSFVNQREAAVCARVALAVLRRLRTDTQLRACKPAILIGVATARLDGLAFLTLRSCLRSLNTFVLAGGSSAQWLTGVLYRDLMGYTIRRCLHDAYKGQRRDPRVTNRGVRVENTSHQSGETRRTTVLNQEELEGIREDFPKREHGDD